MLTLAKILLISTFFSLLLLGSFGKENSEINTTDNNIEVLQTMRKKSIPLESEGKSEKENRENLNINTSISPTLEPLNEEIHTKTTFSSDWSIENSSGSIGPTSTFPTSPPLVIGFVSKLPLNSSVGNEHSLPALVSPSATSPATPSEEFTTSVNTLTNDTRNDPMNSSTTVNILSPAPTTKSVTPLIIEPTTWFSTISDSWTEFTSYQEKTTAQPTLKFTNSSKLFPNTEDPEEVLRLDNAPEPYDVSFGNSSYYNPTVTDSSMPGSQEQAHDGIPMDDIPPLRTSV
ncbi:PREDICTED: mucin-15 isoform X2 [Chrysochloris asiatica]|uniref:Mucin-15 isoform X2 n=1 Tax=Chrysochloris asiatica TaxID=185453 RepID=A0A9B0TW06_CHRAS|nr:PREDICTED: mucin-15 isoform X2 [Chrysochloris asiatica]